MFRKLSIHIAYWEALGVGLGVLRFVGLSDNPNITIKQDEMTLLFFGLLIWGAVLGIVSRVSDFVVERRR